MADLTTLLERVEKATGPYRELDLDIYNALAPEVGFTAFRVENWSEEPGSRLNPYHDGYLIGRSAGDKYADDLPRYTASIDAADALCDRLGFTLEVLCEFQPGTYQALVRKDMRFHKRGPKCSSKALALTAAVIAALIAKDTDNG